MIIKCGHIVFVQTEISPQSRFNQWQMTAGSAVFTCGDHLLLQTEMSPSSKFNQWWMTTGLNVSTLGPHYVSAKRNEFFG